MNVGFPRRPRAVASESPAAAYAAGRDIRRTRPRFPAATSAATTNLCHLLAGHIQTLFADLQDGSGSAYGSVGLPGSCPVVSGRDPRRGDRPFVNQIIMGYWGGPAVGGEDGWPTYGSAASQGIPWQSRVEIVQQPEVLGVRQDDLAVGSADVSGE